VVPIRFSKTDRSETEEPSPFFVRAYFGWISSLLPCAPGGLITGIFAAPVAGGVITLLSPVLGGVMTAGDCGTCADWSGAD
jgi:hypothetical protein